MGQKSTGRRLRSISYALAQYAPGLRPDDENRRVAQLDAQIEHLVHAVRPGLLRDRIDAYGRSARRYRALRRDAARVGAAIRPDDRSGHADLENGAPNATPV